MESGKCTLKRDATLYPSPLQSSGVGRRFISFDIVKRTYLEGQSGRIYTQEDISNPCLHNSTFLVVDTRQILVNAQKYKEIDDSYPSLL